MPITDSGKNWQRNHPDMTKAHRQRYMEDKTTLLIHKTVLEAIDSVRGGLSRQDYIGCSMLADLIFTQNLSRQEISDISNGLITNDNAIALMEKIKASEPEKLAKFTEVLEETSPENLKLLTLAGFLHLVILKSEVKS